MSATQFSKSVTAPAAAACAPSVITFTPQRLGTLVGFADLEIPNLGLRIRAAVHESGGDRWVVPTEVQRDGRIVVLQFGDAGTANCFSQRVLAALLESFPDAFSPPAGGESLHARDNSGSAA